MAESAITFALETVQDLLMEERPFLLGVRDEVEEIEKELKRMKSYLEYVSTKEKELILGEMALKLKREIREVAEEVDDVLKKFAKEVASRKRLRLRSRGKKIDLKRLACFFNDHINVSKKRSEVISAKEKITNLSCRLTSYGFRQVPDRLDSAHERQQQLFSPTYPHFDEDATSVGMEEDISQLVFHLVNNNEEETQCQVVSICGMGGLGKTTLAKKLYNHAEVRRCFNLFSWTCLSQTRERRHTLTDTLQDIFLGLVPGNRKEVGAMTETELFHKICQVQEESKCLIVIDDIWTIDAWNSLRGAFPTGKSKTGSKVLLTTQNKEIALQADPNGYLHEVKFLTYEESWDLLQTIFEFSNRYMRTEFTIDPIREKLGKEMVRHCMGLPLAVKVLGGILIRKHGYDEWYTVLRNLKFARGNLKEDEEGKLDILDLSYNNLPNQLKQCFLFFGKFPHNFEIKATRLYHLWIAELGIVLVEHQRPGETMMDVAERSLDELAQFYMVQVGRKEGPTTRRIKSCRVHDLMIDLCLSKLQSNNAIKQGRTIYYNSDQHDKDDVGGHLLDPKDQIARRVLSLVFFRGGEKFWIKTKPNLNNFQLLRVLDLEGLEMKGENLPESIGNLVELRYLSLRCTSSSLVLWELPSSIINLQYLQILDLRTPVHPLLVPDVLCKLQQLTHLYLPTKIDFDREKGNKLRLGGLSNLETLVNFNSNYCHIEDLKNLRKLRKLKAQVWEGFEYMRELVNIITSAETLLKESKLKIMGFRFHSEKELEILNKLLGCHHLCKLDLQGPISTLPGHDHFSQSLTDLNLWESHLKEDPMPTLEKLPSLFSLHVGRDVFMGSEMVCSPTGFPQLRTLVLADLPNLENWEVNEGAFPKLSKLEIHSCKMLGMIPDGLKFVTTLHEVHIHYMPEQFELRNKAKVEKGKEVEDIHKVRHNLTIKFYNTCAKVSITSMERKDGQLSDPDSDRCMVDQAHIAKKKKDSSAHVKEMSFQPTDKFSKTHTTRPHTIRLKMPKKVSRRKCFLPAPNTTSEHDDILLAMILEAKKEKLGITIQDEHCTSRSILLSSELSIGDEDQLRREATKIQDLKEQEEASSKMNGTPILENKEEHSANHDIAIGYCSTKGVATTLQQQKENHVPHLTVSTSTYCPRRIQSTIADEAIKLMGTCLLDRLKSTPFERVSSVVEGALGIYDSIKALKGDPSTLQKIIDSYVQDVNAYLVLKVRQIERLSSTDLEVIRAEAKKNLNTASSILASTECRRIECEETLKQTKEEHAILEEKMHLVQQKQLQLEEDLRTMITEVDAAKEDVANLEKAMRDVEATSFIIPEEEKALEELRGMVESRRESLDPLKWMD